MKINVHSSVGRRRTSNQDYADFFTNKHGQTLMVLCDGVGGHQAGDVASYKTTEFLGQVFKDQDQALTLASVQSWMKTAIDQVNQYIYQASKADNQLQGMGTTLVLASIVEDHLIIGHVGDSRAYIFKNDQLIRMTEDHSLVNELIKSGEITLEEGLSHPQRNVVTQSIGGTSQVKAEIKVLSVEDIQVVMLCSDGLTNMVDEMKLLEMFKKDRHDPEFAQKLIDAANEAGGADNITVIIATELDYEEVAP
ncbi:TPA: Stp1/IreP family PP2C-type Ser/Thr phosphatase [Streptococcus suis]